MNLDLSSPLIYLITTGEASDRNFDADRLRIVSTVERAIDLEVPLVQIREKNLSARNLFALTTDLVTISRRTGTRILVNDRADVARSAGADGVHLTSSSLPARVVREMFGHDFLVGVSTHTAAEVAAAKEAADFVVYGPVFPTPGKSDPAGVEGLGEVCRANAGLPILGLGGIDSSNFKQVLRNGAAGIAAIRSLNDPDSLAKIVKEIREH